MALAEPTIIDLISAQPREARDPPLPPDLLPRPGEPSRVSALGDREYIASGSFSPALTAYYLALQTIYDQIETQFGDDSYDRMMTDPMVFSCIHFLKQSVISQEIQLAPPIGDKDSGYAEALKIADFCKRSLDRLEHFRTGTLYEMMDALVYGHRLAEMVFEIAPSGPDVGRLVLKLLKVKPRHRYAFMVDSYMNPIGVLGVIPGRAPWLTSTIAVGDPAQVPNLLPLSKFVVLTIHPKEGDPRGRSLLRSAYNPWWLKQQVFPELLKYLLQFAGPSLLGITSKDVQKTVDKNLDGTPKIDADTGQPVFIDPEALLNQALLAFRNSTVLTVPFGTEVKPIFAYGDDGAAFRTSIDMLDRQISQAILEQTLATMEGKHQSRSASEVHEDTLSMPVQYIKSKVEEMIRSMFLPLIRVNFGEEAVKWAPKVSLGDTEQQNFWRNAGAVAQLQTAGWFDPSQMRDMDTRLGLPPRTAEDVQRREDAAAAPTMLTEAQVEAAKGGLQAANGGQAGKGGGQQPASGNGKQSGEKAQMSLAAEQQMEEAMALIGAMAAQVEEMRRAA